MLRPLLTQAIFSKSDDMVRTEMPCCTRRCVRRFLHIARCEREAERCMLCSMSFGARCSSHGVHRERNCCNWLQLLQLVPTCCNWLQRVVRSKLHRKGRVACLLRRMHCMLSAACHVAHHLAVQHTLCGHSIACALRRVRRCGRRSAWSTPAIMQITAYNKTRRACNSPCAAYKIHRYGRRHSA